VEKFCSERAERTTQNRQKKRLRRPQIGKLRPSAARSSPRRACGELEQQDLQPTPATAIMQGSRGRRRGGARLRALLRSEVYMVNFAWLNETPASEWTPDGAKLLRQVFSLAWFKKKSEIDDDPKDAWKVLFDRWGNTQPRRYRHFAPAIVDGAPTIMIVANRG
jgi:hypothetical protein